jgi:hypothetical protein
MILTPPVEEPFLMHAAVSLAVIQTTINVVKILLEDLLEVTMTMHAVVEIMVEVLILQ